MIIAESWGYTVGDFDLDHFTSCLVNLVQVMVRTNKIGVEFHKDTLNHLKYNIL